MNSSLFNKVPLLIGLALGLVGSFVFPAVGSVVVDFSEYSTGPLATQSGGTGLSGSWAGAAASTVVSVDLSGPAASSALILPQTGTAQSAQPPTANYIAPYDHQTYVNFSSSLAGTVWASFLLQGNTGAGGIGINSQGVHPDRGSDVTLMRSLNTFGFRENSGAINGTGGASAEGFVSVPGGGTDLFVVAKFTLGGAANDDVIEAWLNPTSLSTFDSAPNTSTTVDITGNSIDSFSLVGWQSSSSPYKIDNIRFGTELLDVVNNVPEPGTLVLFGAGLLSILAVRRTYGRG